MKKTIRNLQPWLDYFEMLQQYERSGYVEIHADKKEAYVTESALHTLAVADTQQDMLKRLRAYAAVIRHLHAYAAWKMRSGYDFMKEPFAVNIVKDDMPHDMVSTALITRRRRWWWPWKKKEHIEIINY